MVLEEEMNKWKAFCRLAPLLVSASLMAVFAEAQQETAGQETGDMPSVYYARADSCLDRSDFRGAIACLKNALDASSDDTFRSKVQWEIASIYSFFLEDYSGAEKEYKKFIEQFRGDPHIDEANFRLGKIYFNKKDPSRAAEYLKNVSYDSEFYNEAQSLLTWLQDHWKTESYFHAKKIMIGISILEIAFVICWILLGNEHQIHIIIKRPSFVGLFILVLIFLMVKLYFNFMLYNLLQGMMS